MKVYVDEFHKTVHFAGSYYSPTLLESKPEVEQQVHRDFAQSTFDLNNAKDYKLPKGITLEFDDTDKAVKDKMKGKKGRVEIIYTAYTINTGLSDAIFK